MITEQRWIELASGALRGVTPDQARDIGRLCYYRQTKKLEPNCVWHGSSLYFGHKCNCVGCRRQIVEPDLVCNKSDF